MYGEALNHLQNYKCYTTNTKKKKIIRHSKTAIFVAENPALWIKLLWLHKKYTTILDADSCDLFCSRKLIRFSILFHQNDFTELKKEFFFFIFTLAMVTVSLVEKTPSIFDFNHKDHSTTTELFKVNYDKKLVWKLMLTVNLSNYYVIYSLFYSIESSTI